jgi:nicotinate-nucleotide--dimethylbenzimidazole phosphoribosyltransferase
MMKPDWISNPVKQLDDRVLTAALKHQAQLTKPIGSLGRLEELAVRLAAMQGNERPVLDRIRVVVFAGDHGVAEEGVSCFPQSVTIEMLRNFAAGGAAISVLARTLGADQEVVDVGSATDPGPIDGVISLRAGNGTANFRKGPAMDERQLSYALAVGCDAAYRAAEAGYQLFIGGEMGIANTSSATALACALLGQPAELIVGPGTGLSREGVARKAEVIQKALELHGDMTNAPWKAMLCVGGYEIAALVGAYIRCAQLGVTVLVDGFIATTAALVANRMNAKVAPWLIYAHRSAEPGFRKIIDALGAEPLLDLGMCLGEGSGAAMAVPVLRLALNLHNEMATFQQAAVSEQHD